jgi:hypothetical protein
MARSENSVSFQYDICLSFAGEDRPYVEHFASEARARGIKVFYDRYEQATLWGKDLYTHLDKVYRQSGRYCIIFVSVNYKKKLWSNHERRSAQARAFNENQEYILPARFDDTEIPGILNTVGYLDLRATTPSMLADLIQEKLAEIPKEDVLPTDLSELYASLGVESEIEREEISFITHDFYRGLRKMSDEERAVIFTIFIHGCPASLPENVHMSIDLIRRYTGYSIVKIKRLLGGIRSLGYYSRIEEKGCDEEAEALGAMPVIYLEWVNMSTGTGGGNQTEVASEIVSVATAGFCECHCLEALLRLDFSGLASSRMGACPSQKHND